MFSFLKPAPFVDRLPPDQIDREYRRLRLRVFAGIFLGYAAYYLVRKNFSLAMPDILKEYPQYSKAQLGTAMTGLSIAYGFSKFLMGSISDRSNPRYFLPLGLLLVALFQSSVPMRRVAILGTAAALGATLWTGLPLFFASACQ